MSEGDGAEPPEPDGGERCVERHDMAAPLESGGDRRDWRGGDPPEKRGDPPSVQWPDSLVFWLAITFGTLAVAVAICAGALRLARWAYTG
jgi:hypothetical protein